MSDALENASGGFTDLDDLARNNTLVVARIKDFLPEETSSEGYKSLPVMADLLICSGPDKGDVVRGMKIKKGGITNTLRRSNVGKDVAGLIKVKLNDKRKDRDGNPQPFAAMDPCTAEQLADVKLVYRDGTGFDSNSNLVGATAGTSGNSAAPAADSDLPPF